MKHTDDEVLAQIVSTLLDLMPELEGTTITPESSLRDLGANSVDRMEVVVDTMDWAGVQIPLVEFAQLNNIGEIVAVIQRHAAQA